LELGCVSAIDSSERTIWIVDAHRHGGKRFVAHVRRKSGGLLEVESAVRGLLNDGLELRFKE
jgi:hypothetical protein